MSYSTSLWRQSRHYKGERNHGHWPRVLRELLGTRHLVLGEVMGVSTKQCYCLSHNIWWNSRLSALCTAVSLSIRSSILSCVLHKPRFKAFRKRELILALSLWDNWPAKEGRAYVTTDSTIAVKTETYMQCILHHETYLDILTDLVSTSAD